MNSFSLKQNTQMSNSDYNLMKILHFVWLNSIDGVCLVTSVKMLFDPIFKCFKDNLQIFF
jgi:hypothetical protein